LTADTLDIVFVWAGMFLAIVLLAMATWQRVFRTMPIFFCYLVWCVCSATVVPAALHLSAENYLRYFLLSMAIDDSFHFAILAELGRAVLRYNDAASPKRSTLVLLMTLAIVLVWSLGRWVFPTRLPAIQLTYVLLLQGFAILRVACLLTLAWWSSLHAFRWPTRALQIASGFGVYAVVSLGTALLHTHGMTGVQYHWLDQIQVASYLGALSYWVLAFGTKEVESKILIPNR
jgi:hypothetical protein